MLKAPLTGRPGRSLIGFAHPNLISKTATPLFLNINDGAETVLPYLKK
jgi:hypothetical protein